MTEPEFWSTTLAKVTALYQVAILDWARTRDTFPAELLASFLASKGATMPDGSAPTGERMLLMRYPRRTPEVKIDPDRGAAGGWRQLKSSMKAITKK